MALLERLTIRGIRNFGVDAEDEQVCTACTLGRTQISLLVDYKNEI